MKTFWFIRHGESEGNAGLPSTSAGDIPLTEKGRDQAEYIAKYIDEKPELFVISPYLRASQTFEPTRNKFPAVPAEIWPIQEYTYLPPENYRNTTTDQRRGASSDYFKRGDPDYAIGEGGESFNHFRDRVQETIQKLKSGEETKTILFGHGWFMRCILWELLVNSEMRNKEKRSYLTGLKAKLPTDPFPYWMTRIFGLAAGKRTMMKFLVFSAAFRIPNASILKFHISPDGKLALDEYIYSHIPADLQGELLIDS